MDDANNFKGYKGRALEVLKHFQAMVWSDVKIATARGEYTGIILPRSEAADPLHIVLKLRSGYNIGILAESVTAVDIQGRKEAHYKIPE
ncbi:MAG: Glu-tRNA(Gln) amidotransferase GatDE subunit D, partial [Candidatus Aminicenantes bacterium]|nr:Glu-tRNA(Gln) amidotransferase GatDE subunit D [Candidatus Aminicenantes bacterium]